MPCVATWAVRLQKDGESDGEGALALRLTTTAPSALADVLAAVALFNIGEDPANAMTLFSALGLGGPGVFRVLDVWAGTALGVFNASGGFSVLLRPHASFLLTVEAVNYL